jgi:hypothetical protein
MLPNSGKAISKRIPETIALLGYTNSQKITKIKLQRLSIVNPSPRKASIQKVSGLTKNDNKDKPIPTAAQRLRMKSMRNSRFLVFILKVKNSIIKDDFRRIIIVRTKSPITFGL